MAISRARRNFRKVLGVLLILSFTFFATTASLYAAIKLKFIHMNDIAPSLISADILQHQARLNFFDQAGQFEITKKMLRQGFFSPLYTQAGLVMLDNLAATGYTPAQALQTDLKLRMAEFEKRTANEYQKLASQ